MWRKDGDIERVGRGMYVLPTQNTNSGQIGQKERSVLEAPEIVGENHDLSDLSDLSIDDEDWSAG
jgi:hypothetical protein